MMLLVLVWVLRLLCLVDDFSGRLFMVKFMCCLIWYILVLQQVCLFFLVLWVYLWVLILFLLVMLVLILLFMIMQGRYMFIMFFGVNCFLNVFSVNRWCLFMNWWMCVIVLFLVMWNGSIVFGIVLLVICLLMLNIWWYQWQCVVIVFLVLIVILVLQLVYLKFIRLVVLVVMLCVFEVMIVL